MKYPDHEARFERQKQALKLYGEGVMTASEAICDIMEASGWMPPTGSFIVRSVCAAAPRKLRHEAFALVDRARDLLEAGKKRLNTIPELLAVERGRADFYEAAWKAETAAHTLTRDMCKSWETSSKGNWETVLILQKQLEEARSKT